MTAHAIEHQHECRIFGNDYRGTILVVLAVTESRYFCVFDLHLLFLFVFARCPMMSARSIPAASYTLLAKLLRIAGAAKPSNYAAGLPRNL